jgi:hypothetical protein
MAVSWPVPVFLIGALGAAAVTGTLAKQDGRMGVQRRAVAIDQSALPVWPGVRRAGLPEAEPGADAGPAAPQAPP